MPLLIANDMEFLGSLRLSSAAVSTGVLSIPARERLTVHCNVAGYSGTDIASLRFNGDTGTNYWDRHIVWNAAATAATIPTGGATAQNLSTTLIRLAGNGVTTAQMVVVDIINILGVSKAVCMTVQTASGAAGTGGVLDIGGGEWVNTTAQITSVEMRTAGGTITMPAGTSISVFGINP